ncbi:protein of unknown function DUF932 [Myxococcus phage Mx1]|nr:protein of unknown function DUF932 [Myxococcus phage Mx1]
MGGLNWDVAFAEAGGLVEVDDGNGGKAKKLLMMKGQKLIYREDTKQPLGIVGARYEAFQNSTAFAIVTDLLKETGATLVRAGTFAGGAGTFMSMQLGGFNVGKDQGEKFLTLVNTHDGSMTYKGLLTPYRIFCSNQIRAALGKYGRDSFSIRHTNAGKSMLDEAHKAVIQANKYYEMFGQMANALVSTKYSARQMRELAEKLFPVKLAEGEVIEGKIITDDDVSTRTKNNREALVSLMETGMGHKETGIVGTAWGALQAVTEYADHHRTTRGHGGNKVTESLMRTEQAWFGAGAQFKYDGMTHILEQTGLKV